MLKMLFIDVNPYFIQGKIISSLTWSKLEARNFINIMVDKYPEVESLLTKRKSLFTDQGEYLKKINSTSYEEIAAGWQVDCEESIQEYIKTNPLHENIEKLLKDSLDGNIKVILVTSNKNYENVETLYPQIKKYKIKVIKLDDYSTLDSKFVIDYASNNDISFNEVGVITQLGQVLINLQQNNIFSFSIDSDEISNETNHTYVDDISKINLENLLFYFYDYEKKSNSII